MRFRCDRHLSGNHADALIMKINSTYKITGQTFIIFFDNKIGTCINKQ